jgi:hypothetical protein
MSKFDVFIMGAAFAGAAYRSWEQRNSDTLYALAGLSCFGAVSEIVGEHPSNWNGAIDIVIYAFALVALGFVINRGRA